MNIEEAVENLKSWNEKHKELSLAEKLERTEYRELRSEVQKANHSTNEFRTKSSKSHEDAWMDPSKRLVMLAGNRRQAEAKSRKMLAAWSDPEFREKRLEARRRGAKKSGHQISSLEKKTIKLLVKIGYSKTYRYNGLHGTKIGVYIPDFLHISKNKVIDVFGNYFHNSSQQNRDNRRIEEIKNLGYEVLIVREYDFDDLELLIERIRKFTEE